MAVSGGSQQLEEGKGIYVDFTWTKSEIRCKE